ncbi:MAG: cytidylate kinase-like family protein [Opitutaceae bacterium]
MKRYHINPFADLVGQYRHPASDSMSDMDHGPFVTISRESGSGGTSLASMLARHLNSEASKEAQWTIFDANLIATVLKTHHLQPQLARFLPEDRLPEFESAIGEMVGLHPNLWDLVKKTNETISQLAQKGHVILVGRGASFVTADLDNGLHVRTVAPAAQRAHFVAHRYDMTEELALAYNERCDAASRRYVKSNFNADITDPSNYDLVINTGRISLGDAANLIANLVNARSKVPALA